jgi:iron complex outermembrane recepter protein
VKLDYPSNRSVLYRRSDGVKGGLGMKERLDMGRARALEWPYRWKTIDSRSVTPDAFPMRTPNLPLESLRRRVTMVSTSVASQRIPVVALLLILHAVAPGMPARAQPVEGVEAPAEYQRGVEQADDPGGTTDEIDAADAQAEEAKPAGGEVPGLGRKATKQVEEIVVTARKREEALEDTPVAVTALGAASLRESSVLRIDQLRELVPSLHIQQTQQGNIALFNIRGVGTGSQDLQFDPGVAVYLDGVFLPRAPGSLLSVVDVQQIEVLRGPQGTLFGKNSVGGAINITTVKPQPDLEGFAMLRPGNLNGLDTEVMLNVPVVEDLVLSRVSFFTTQRDGYVSDPFRNELYSDANDMVFLGSLRFLPADDVTFDITGTWSRSHTKGNGGPCIVVREDGPVASLFPGLFPACRATSAFEWSADTAGLSDIETAGTWGVLNYDIGDAWVLEDLAIKAIGSWNQQTTRLRFDVDGTDQPIVYLSTAGPPPIDGEPGEAQQESAELQLNGGALDGRLVFVTGLFAQWEDGSDDRTTNVGPPLTASSSRTIATIDNWTWAPYTQLTGNVTDWLSLTGGVRYTQDKKGFSLFQSNPITGAVTFPETSDSKIFEKWTPMASIASIVPIDLLPDWADHFMGYFTYSQGFKGGGFNALPGAVVTGENTLAQPFDPETLDNYEIGFKTILLENRVTLNTAFYYGIYDDIQKISIVTMGEGEDIEVQRITENAAKATIQGFEIELLALPIDGLQITGNIAVNDTEYDSFPNAISDFNDQEIDRSGESFNYVPEFTSFLGAQYSFPIEGDAKMLQGWLTPRFEWYYQSAIHLNGPEIKASNQPGYNLLNARLSYDFWDDRAQVALWTKNLADQEYIFYSTPTVSTFGTVVNFTGLPRTFGAELSYRF